MSENIPESIPTSADPKSRRPTKKSRGSAPAMSAQSAAVTALFEKQGLDKDVYIPSSATRGPRTADSLAPPPEIVANVQGSSAGAGSGEFHVYKAARRREYERIRLMEHESKREEADKAWLARTEENKAKDEARTSKNARKREKAKARKNKEKNANGVDEKRGAQVGAVAEDGLTESNGHKRDANGEQNAASTEAADQGNGIVIHDDD